MFEDIIHTSKSEDYSLYKRPRQIYESTYLGKTKIIDYKFVEINCKEQIIEDDKVITKNIYNFWNKSYENVANILLSKYLKEFISIYENAIIQDFKLGFNKQNINDYLLTFLSMISDSTKDFRIISNVIHEICPDEYDKKVFIEFLSNLNSFFSKIKLIDTENTIKKITMSAISEKFVNILIELVKSNGIEIYKEFTTNHKLNNIFNDNILFRYLVYEDREKFTKTLFDQITNIKRTSLMNNNFIDILDHISTITENIELEANDINKFENLGIISNYICASFYYLVRDRNYSLIKKLIKFNKIIVTDYDFLKNYLYHFKKRVEHELNYEVENNIYNFIKDIYHDSNDKILDDIRYCIEDLYISDHMMNEVYNLEIIAKSDIKHLEYDLSKIKLLITSNIKWDEINIKDYNINCESLNLYQNIINNYYKKKYNNRQLKISNEDSNIDIRLGNSFIRLSFICYDILKLIGTGKCNDINELIKVTNLKEDYVKGIINLFKKHNLIIINDKILFNENILKEKLRINLSQEKIIVEIKKIEFSELTNDIIDAFIVKICKQSSKSIIYEILKKQLFDKLRLFTKPEDKKIKERLERLITLEYIGINEDNEYYYIL